MNSHAERLHLFWAPWAPLIFVFDLVAVYGSGLAAAWLLATYSPSPQTSFLWPVPSSFNGAILVAACLLPLVIHALNGYRPWRGKRLLAEVWLVLCAWLGVFALLAVMALLTKSGALFSRRWIMLWFSGGLLALSFGRILLRVALREMRRRGLDTKRIVLIGSGELALRVHKVLQLNTWAGLRIVGYFDDLPSAQMPPDCVRLGAFEDVSTRLRQEDVNQVWFVLPLSAEITIQKILESLQGRSLDIRIVPDIFGYQLLNHSVENVAGLPVLNFSTSPHKGLDRILKRLMDIAAALCGLLLLAPILALIALAVRLTSPGPVIFNQVRHGWDGQPFQMYKFRTMYVQREPDSGYQQARRGDARVTPAGRWLRRSSLDELAQLFNVLIGDMSLVGPRPHPVEMNEKYQAQVERYMQRHHVKPGITGWAQVNGFRGETDTLEKLRGRIEHDLYYIEHWTLSLDIKILLLTVLRGFRDPNAY